MADKDSLEKESATAAAEDAMGPSGEMQEGAEAQAETGGAAGEEAEAATELEQLEEALEEAKAEAEEYLDGWRRAQAEFSNYKKRQRAEQAKVHELANANLLRKLLPVLDDFDRAISTMPQGVEKLSWTQGLLMVKRKLEAILETEGVEPVETEGASFDPHYHEAVTHEEMPGYEDGQIIGEVQKGYVLGDRVLRPALVRVAKASSAPAETDDEVGTGRVEEEGADSQAGEE